uniref:Acrosin n=1 Tax=Nothoprocta perdicaria TaxID=30464 RepID=A0A8C6ZYV2_NOTPE
KMKLLLLLLLLAACWPVWGCGVRTVSSYNNTMRVVGGWNAQPGSWPWIVSIQVPWAEGTGHICGGSLITAEWVLTAAHCFINASYVELWRLVIGTSNLYELGPEAQVRYIKTLIIHEHYNNVTHVHDLALLQLDQPVQCNYYVQLACVADSSVQVSKLSPCYVGGWGAMYEGGEFPTSAGVPKILPYILQEALVNLIDIRICNRSDWNAWIIEKTHLCAGFPQGGTGTCQGDSGGPLICKDQIGDFYWLVGVTSWGKGCARPQLPGVYSSVQHYYNWIVSHISAAQESSWRWGHSSSGFNQFYKPVPTQSYRPNPCPYPRHKLVEFFTGVEQLLNTLKRNRP